MTRRRFLFALVFLAAAGLLASCNFPRPPSPQEVASTAAAETVSAQLTLVSAATPTVPSTNTPVPLPATNTPTPPATLPPPPTATQGCSDESQYVSDVTIPDNTIMTPGQNFTKTWRIRNTGTCTWSTSYDAVFVDGNAMGGQASVALVGSVPPNSTVDISINLSAPSSNGTHRGNYRLRDDTDVLFGTLFFVQIIVGPTPTPTVVVYRTGDLTIDNSFKADLDAGTITGDSSADIWLHAVSADERYLDPQNGALLREMGGTPSYNDCSTASLSGNDVDFDDFSEGSWFCYKTSSNRYGRFEVENEDDDSISIDFRTWN